VKVRMGRSIFTPGDFSRSQPAISRISLHLTKSLKNSPDIIMLLDRRFDDAYPKVYHQD
jgi:hypothetical protein